MNSDSDRASTQHIFFDAIPVETQREGYASVQQETSIIRKWWEVLYIFVKNCQGNPVCCVGKHGSNNHTNFAPSPGNAFDMGLPHICTHPYITAHKYNTWIAYPNAHTTKNHKSSTLCDALSKTVGFNPLKLKQRSAFLILCESMWWLFQGYMGAKFCSWGHPYHCNCGCPPRNLVVLRSFYLFLG